VISESTGKIAKWFAAVIQIERTELELGVAPYIKSPRRAASMRRFANIFPVLRSELLLILAVVLRRGSSCFYFRGGFPVF